ncbi:phage tail tube protein [Martelella mangrovi]|uniref:Phage tail protein n=1 Tax=Martelella mangrovi TaxID=1397477 RepID=A0ABV2IHF8_9HYPH
MAEAKTTTFGKLLIKLGDGADPEVFAQPCGMTSKSLTFSKNTGETLVVDCDDEDQVTWLERNAESLSASVSGDGVLAASSIQPWWAAFASTEAINCELSIQYSTGTMKWTGPFHVTSFEISGEKSGDPKVKSAIQMDSAGAIENEWVAA